MDSFPYDSWEEAATAAMENGEGYFTFGPGGNAATIFLTILGIIFMLAVMVTFVVTENARLNEHAARIREEGIN
ncbi:MAG: hypothetical protein GY773_12230 [Actinomycetia bacterium]|nr:hypothetical protein [Actinomycetes bacterium]